MKKNSIDGMGLTESWRKFSVNELVGDEVCSSSVPMRVDLFREPGEPSLFDVISNPPKTFSIFGD